MLPAEFGKQNQERRDLHVGERSESGGWTGVTPLGILLGIIAAAKKQTALGVIGIIIAVASLLMSPSFQLLLIGMGMH